MPCKRLWVWNPIERCWKLHRIKTKNEDNAAGNASYAIITRRTSTLSAYQVTAPVHLSRVSRIVIMQSTSFDPAADGTGGQSDARLGAFGAQLLGSASYLADDQSGEQTVGDGPTAHSLAASGAFAVLFVGVAPHHAPAVRACAAAPGRQMRGVHSRRAQ